MARLCDREESECEAANAIDEDEMQTVSDPCCGSERLLLAAARTNRNRYFVGQDVDHRCAKITAINLALCNLYGKVIWGNTLTNEVRRVYHTGFNGRGCIRVEESSVPAGVRSQPVTADPSPPPNMPGQPSRQGTLFDDPPLE
jgi:hypothetical protein